MLKTRHCLFKSSLRQLQILSFVFVLSFLKHLKYKLKLLIKFETNNRLTYLMIVIVFYFIYYPLKKTLLFTVLDFFLFTLIFGLVKLIYLVF